MNQPPRIPDLSALVEDEGLPDDEGEVLEDFEKLIPNLSDQNIKKAMDGLIAEMEKRVRAASANLAAKEDVLAALRNPSLSPVSITVNKTKSTQSEPKTKGKSKRGKRGRVNAGLSEEVLLIMRGGCKSKGALTKALQQQGRSTGSLGVVLSRLKKAGKIVYDVETKLYQSSESVAGINAET